jgi:hypothetical protein
MSDEEKREEKIEIYLQGEGAAEIRMLDVAPTVTVSELFEEIRHHGHEVTEEHILFLEDEETEYAGGVRLVDIGIGHQSRVHCHRCRKVSVKVHFNGETKHDAFPPSMTIAKVTCWATGSFGMEGPDASEHALQVCNTANRPDEDVHLGALVRFPQCEICFDLVPKVRVEG